LKRGDAPQPGNCHTAVRFGQAANETARRARRAQDSSPRRRAVGSRRAAFASPGTGRKKEGRQGSSAPSRGGGGTSLLPVLTHWATILRPAGWEIVISALAAAAPVVLQSPFST